MVNVRRKPLNWVGSSLDDLKAMPLSIRKEFGVSLDIVQQGLTPLGSKMLHGSAAGAMQLSEDERSGTYRAVYTVVIGDAVYVLHCFQKKSKHGIATPQADIDLIARRLKVARADYLKQKKDS